MSQPIRPVKTFVLRLWHEPGDLETEAGWRGSLRPLNTEGAEISETHFQGLENLIATLRRSLAVAEIPTAPTSQAKHKK
jgi:hypothetical protein